ncbi:Hpt domain-containing protein [Solidesulfovibrio alcoholivorans]|uniref:Hpt domain-containing protein n=1 Tax=Solidesulfovibrio alcoholivorans TaxID=81406 RepID=UPI0006940651|nr:Hpt domain-containing protein [Solidesulfovibrio alcoholivorans]
MTPADVLRQARDFLGNRQMLSAEETEGALDVAAVVLARTLERLDAAITAGDGTACVEAAHGLKGNLLNLGLPELAATAQAILDKAREGGYQSLQTGRESLATALAPLLARGAK